MATTTKSQDLACNMNESLSRETEAQISNSSGRKGGNWIGLALPSGGAFANLIVYLIREFNVKSIDAAQISNVSAGNNLIDLFLQALYYMGFVIFLLNEFFNINLMFGYVEPNHTACLLTPKCNLRDKIGLGTEQSPMQSL
ncbi:Proton-dependent oligopeptide transporter family [Parasponia andersonii]|uniref:Proton-dependent oligopeptide transporter family n=1 Tax=Parasponia andersonii TaxID=3476 RepID=A0A2P5CMV4_PARAD|nr:Proton-dependent oligopeptide transporter family [Parasponia andersonii]